MWNVITYWTFDTLHYWHIELLRRAKTLTWEKWNLIVWVSTDEFNEIKWKISLFAYRKRVELLEALKYVDVIIPEESREQKEKDIKKYNARLVMWDDRKWKFDQYKCIYLPRTEWVSSSLLKTLLH